MHWMNISGLFAVLLDYHSGSCFSPTGYCWGSQCFLSVSALFEMLCPPLWACLPTRLRSWLPSSREAGLGCFACRFPACRQPCLPAISFCFLGCVRLINLVFCRPSLRWSQFYSSSLDYLYNGLYWNEIIFVLDAAYIGRKQRNPTPYIKLVL